MTDLGYHKVSHILEVRRAWEECDDCNGECGELGIAFAYDGRNDGPQRVKES